MQITAEIELAALESQIRSQLGSFDILVLVEGLVEHLSLFSDGGRRLNATMARLGYVPAEALELAAARLTLAANWIENSYVRRALIPTEIAIGSEPDKNVDLVRSYARAARVVVEQGEVR